MILLIEAQGNQALLCVSAGKIGAESKIQPDWLVPVCLWVKVIDRKKQLGGSVVVPACFFATDNGVDW